MDKKHTMESIGNVKKNVGLSRGANFHISLILRWSALFLLGCLLQTSCIQKKQENGNSEEIKAKDQASAIDIFRYKVKEDKYAEDLLKLKFNEILLERISEDTYTLMVNCDLGVSEIDKIEDYYFIFSIYPYDKDIKMLSEDRRKYGFEMFSMNIGHLDNKKKLKIGREISTEIIKARAITLTLMEYDPKRKIREIVMLNVKLK